MYLHLNLYWHNCFDGKFYWYVQMAGFGHMNSNLSD